MSIGSATRAEIEDGYLVASGVLYEQVKLNPEGATPVFDFSFRRRDWGTSTTSALKVIRVRIGFTSPWDDKEVRFYSLPAPGATDLPPGSVVATDHQVWIKEGDEVETLYLAEGGVNRPWGGDWGASCTNEEIDNMITGAGARILRIGTNGDAK
jgi:hypothetical protein